MPLLSYKLKLIEEAIRESHQNEISKKESDAIAMISDNPKYFYAYAKEKKTIRSDIGPLKCKEGNVTADKTQILFPII